MPERDDSELVRQAVERARLARDEAVAARRDADEARAGAEQAHAGAREAEQNAAEHEDRAEDAVEDVESAADTPMVLAEDLLIHPDDIPDAEADDPFGTPGPPMNRRAAFYVGFSGTLGAMLALALALAIRAVGSVLVLVLVAIFLAVGLNPVVEWLMHGGVRRKYAVLVVTVSVLGLVTLFMVALVPVIREQITALVATAPEWLDQVSEKAWVRTLDEKYDVITKIRDKLTAADFAQTAFGNLFTVGLALVNALFNAFIVFVLTLYFLAALPNIKRTCYSLAPASRRTRVTYLGDEILRRVGGYVAGAFVVAACAGVSSFIFLEIVGLASYAVALALLVALLDFIPLIGATIGATVVVLIGFATSPTIGVACAIFFLVYQQLENYLIYPRVMSSSVNVPGVVTVIAVLIGGSLLGVVGALLAIPTAAAGLLLTREVFLRRQDTS